MHLHVYICNDITKHIPQPKRKLKGKTIAMDRKYDRFFERTIKFSTF
jgi:hypothetical protein